MERNNHLTLTRADLHTSLGELYDLVISRDNRIGLPRFTYVDEYDRFELRIERSNTGFSVSCVLNSETSYQLNGRFFGGLKQIGNIMLLAAGAPAQATIDDFFD